MSDFLRPEIRAFLARWAEVMIAAGIGLWGLWWGLGRTGFVSWLGYLMLSGAGIWAVAAIQRARFHQDGEGPGVVQVTERRLSYFGPLDGGFIDLADIVLLEYDPEGHPAPYWVVSGAEGQRLAIPVNAAGADLLFDAFAALPDLPPARLLSVLAHPPAGQAAVWRRDQRVLH